MEKANNTKWENIHSEREWGRYPGEPVIRFVARNFYSKNRKDVKILDFGCGQGAHTWYLAREGFDTYAFDGSPSAVNKTNDRLKDEGLKAVVSVKDALSVDYDDEYFDAVIDAGCICCNNFSDFKSMYANIHRMLKRGGMLYSSGFGYGTTGYGCGTKIENGTYDGIDKGVLADVGLIHFTSESEMGGGAYGHRFFAV